MSGKRITATLLATLCLGTGSLAQARLNMGMVGDSLTDDYLAGPKQINTDLAAYSWGQVLAATRASELHFGIYKPANDLWDNNIRYSGWEYNWATSGGVASNNSKMEVNGFGALPVTVSGTSYLGSQIAGITPLVSDGTLDVVYVGIGSNDFFYHTTRFDAGGNFYPKPPAEIEQAFIDDIASSILTRIDTLQTAAANGGHPVQIVLGLLPPGTVNSTNPYILTGITAVNQLLIQGAAARGIPTVDLFGWNTDPTRADSTTGTVTIGHLQITTDSKASALDVGPTGTGPCDTTGCALPSHANNFVADDGLHPNTIPQALIANQILAALNNFYGHNIPLLRDDEILNLAGVPLPVACQTDADGDGIGAASFSFVASNCPGGTTQIPLVTSALRLGAAIETDNCPYAINPDQLDSNSDGQGDACQGDGDNDGVTDAGDNCPAAPNVDQVDSDGDLAGNACDSDDDNDGITDSKDLWPLDPLESADSDNDGTGNNADPDDDNDTIPDITDNCPFTASADQTDTDGDGLGNPCDSDDDNDSTPDNKDAFPLNPAEQSDNDKDGIGNNADTDDDNDGIPDATDIFPLDATETLDNDMDGKGNNADTDDDNDGTLDTVEVALHTDPFTANPYTATSSRISFEEGIPAGWSKPAGANAGWQLDSSTATHGSNSLRSSPIGHSQRAQIQTSLTIAGTTLTFDLKVSSQPSNDVFRVYVDGSGKLAKAGELGWQTYTIDVTPGTHTIRFEYLKNGSIVAGSDAIWIDNLIYVDGADLDGDNIVNALDTDNDNDGIPDAMDPLPLQPGFNLDGIYRGTAVRELQQQ